MKQQTENQIQTAFFDWVRVHEKQFPELALCYAVPNGSYKSFTARMVHQATGLRSGVPDVHLPIADRINIGLWIEFKSKTGKVSPTQKAWCERLLVRGHRVEICRSWIDAANIVIEYLNLPLKKIAPEI